MNLAGAGRFRMLDRSAGKDLADTLQELFGCQAVEVLDATVVWQDAQLRRGEEHSQKPVVLLLAGMFRVGFAPDATCAGCGSGAVVTIGYVAARDGGKGLDPGRGRCFHAPDRMADAVDSDKVVEWGAVGGIGHEAVHRRHVAVGQENRPGIGVELKAVAGAVVFLVLAGLFVLAHDILRIVINVAADHQTGLGMRAHDLAIDVQVLAGLPDQRATLLKLGKGLGTLGVDAIIMNVDAVREVDLRAGDMQEAVRVAGGEGAGFGGIHDIVGDRRKGGSAFRGGTQGGKRFDLHGSKQNGREPEEDLGRRGIGLSVGLEAEIDYRAERYGRFPDDIHQADLVAMHEFRAVYQTNLQTNHLVGQIQNADLEAIHGGCVVPEADLHAGQMAGVVEKGDLNTAHFVAHDIVNHIHLNRPGIVGLAPQAHVQAGDRVVLTIGDADAKSGHIRRAVEPVRDANVRGPGILRESAANQGSAEDQNRKQLLH